MILKFNAYYRNNRLLSNAVFSVMQIVFVGLTYFIIYTLLLHKLGPEKLGIWSLILSTTSVANVATTGLTLSLVKYIALHNVEADYIKINKFIKTGIFIISTLTVGIICVIFFLALFFLPFVIPKKDLNEALFLLPFSLFSLFLNGIGGVFLSSLEGMHHSALKSISYILSSILFTVFAYFLINQYGLFGIAIAQIIQAIALIILGIFFLKLVFKKLVIFPVSFDKTIFKEIFAYSASFQFISISTILVEPAVKFMISRFGGLAFVGFYEMGSRLVSQIRGLIISANQIMVPYISRNFSEKSTKLDSTYPLLFKLVYYISVYLMILLITLAPVISILWIGNFNEVFIKTLIILSAATAFNLLSTPAYFSSMGMGSLTGILASHATFLASNCLLGYVLGLYFAGLGVIVGYGISYVLCSFVTIIYYHKTYNFSIFNLLNKEKEGVWISISLAAYILLSYILVKHTINLNISFYIFLCFFLSFIFIYTLYLKDPELKLLKLKIQKVFKTNNQ